MLAPGTPAPLFHAKDQNGNKVGLQDFQGRKVALYFYPKDDTPGCTAQACNLRDNTSALADAGITILGVSSDDETSHKQFEEKYSLPFTLVADPDAEICRAYDVWGENVWQGKTYMWASRVTYLINEQGVITGVIDRVDTGDHTQQVIAGFNA